MLYAEPFSAYDGKDNPYHNKNGINWDGKASQKSFGDQMETIIQRSTVYYITKAEKRGEKYYFEMEVRQQTR